MYTLFKGVSVTAFIYALNINTHNVCCMDVLSVILSVKKNNIYIYIYETPFAVH